MLLSKNKKHEFLPASQASLDSTSRMGSCTGEVLATLDTLEYSKRFQTINFAPKLLALCVTEFV